MQVTYIGLSEYFQRCIPKAKRKGYFLIISLIVRYSDAQDPVSYTHLIEIVINDCIHKIIGAFAILH